MKESNEQNEGKALPQCREAYSVHPKGYAAPTVLLLFGNSNPRLPSIPISTKSQMSPVFKC